MIAAGMEAFPEQAEQVKRLSSMIYTTMGAVGGILMRFVSGSLADWAGFRSSMDIQASMLLVFSGFYASFLVFWVTSKHKQVKSLRLKQPMKKNSCL